MRISVKASHTRERCALAASRPFAELADLALAEGDIAQATRCIENAYQAYDAALSASQSVPLSPPFAFAPAGCRLCIAWWLQFGLSARPLATGWVPRFGV